MSADGSLGTHPLDMQHAGMRLLWAANGVLPLVPHVLATGFVADLSQLRMKLQSVLVDFQSRARNGGVEAARIARATEVLAALLDQVVTSMPWGAEAGWQSLSATADANQASPAQRLLDLAAFSYDTGLAELIGVSLALGFDRRSAGAEEALIDKVRSRLAAHAPAQRASDRGTGLPPQAQTAIEAGAAFKGWLLLWVSSLVTAALLACVFYALEHSLSTKSDRVYANLATLQRPRAPALLPPPAANPRLIPALLKQTDAHELTVRDEIDRSVVVIPAVLLFEDGNATLLTPGTELLRAVARAIEHTPGRIEIIGHTDAAQPRSARYVSDWDLSVERARSVQNALHGFGIAANRLASDGHAGVEPLRSEDPARAIGGDARVEILLLAGR